MTPAKEEMEKKAHDIATRMDALYDECVGVVIEHPGRENTYSPFASERYERERRELVAQALLEAHAKGLEDAAKLVEELEGVDYGIRSLASKEGGT